MKSTKKGITNWLSYIYIYIYNLDSIVFRIAVCFKIKIFAIKYT